VIRVITGYMGTGKSLYAVRYIYQRRHKYKTIVTNTPLNISNAIYTENFRKTIQQAEPPILVFLDEAHMLLDSRRSMSKTAISWTQLLTLLRKLGIDLILTTQSLRQVDVRLRSLLRSFWIAKGLQWLETETGDLQPYFVYEQYAVRMDPWDGSYIRHWIRTEFLWWYNAAQYFALYDTNFIPADWQEEQEEYPTLQNIPPGAFEGEYPRAGEIVDLLKSYGFHAHKNNYRKILASLGYEVSVLQLHSGERIYKVQQTNK